MIKLLSVADLITITNAVLGFLSVFFIFQNEFQIAASLILIGLIADGLDGMVARRYGNGTMGEFLEAIADSLSLSVAPLFLFTAMSSDAFASSLPLQLLVGIVIVFSFVCCTVRLSSFTQFKTHSYFVGLPASANAIFLVMSSFLPVDLWHILPFIVLFALLMVSPVRFPKQGIKTDAVAAGFIVAAILLTFLYEPAAPYVLLVGLLLYIIVGPVYLAVKKKTS